MKKALVYGLKSSGLAVINVLLKEYEVYVYDDSNLTLQKVIKEYNGKVKQFESFSNENLKELSFIVISPSISIYKPEIIKAKELDVDVIGELEFGYKCGIRPLVSVTGSNGKSTTVKLIEYIFKVAGKSAKAVGNIGEPITNFLSTKNKNLINEVSSFQLETIKSYSSPISVILNVSPNHLDRHFNFETYLNTKLKIFYYLNDEDIKIVNYDDDNLKKITLPKTFFFSMTQKVRGAYYKDGYLYLNIKRKTNLISKEELKLKGNHNIQNILAASLVCYFAGIKIKYIKSALRNFLGLEHRLTFVDKKNDITFINDSKSTSADSCLVAVNSFNEDIYLLLGGKDKGLDYKEMFKKMPKNVKAVFLYGETLKIMKNDLLLGNTNLCYYETKTLNEAIEKSYKVATKNSIILLSPATSSFDEFSCFEERGEFFIKKVKELEWKINL